MSNAEAARPWKWARYDSWKRDTATHTEHDHTPAYQFPGAARDAANRRRHLGVDDTTQLADVVWVHHSSIRFSFQCFENAFE
jgi:hypothetical protein